MDTKTKMTKAKGKAKATVQLPSANWHALQKKLVRPLKKTSKEHPRKKRKIENEKECLVEEGIEDTSRGADTNSPSSSFPRGHVRVVPVGVSVASTSTSTRRLHADGTESVEYLKKMVFGQVEYTESQKEPGKYLALDCEMVGVGLDGTESSLARVSLVNYHGAVILDEFVRQRERVVDYRTAVSGVRAADMVHAKPFLEVQKQVAELLKDRILVGHAVNNDLKALLLSQPRPLIRDTQLCAGKARVLKTKYPALRKLAQQELGITIQAGEHSSVTDARATMALYRLHRKEWDKGFRMMTVSTSFKSVGNKRKAPSEDDKDEMSDNDTNEGEGEDGPQNGPIIQATREQKAVTSVKQTKSNKGKSEFSGGGRRGVSSGLSTIVKRAGQRTKAGKVGETTSKSAGGKEIWWATLGGVSASGQGGAKGTMRIS
ncbi:ribonuclease H-like protein [Phellopilus nigrolimitatus]|nr:ribonuclease H-like protein [Phellopilus nigrolimitatus]